MQCFIAIKNGCLTICASRYEIVLDHVCCQSYGIISVNIRCSEQNGDPPVRPIEELFDDEDEDAFAGYVENSDDEPAA